MSHSFFLSGSREALLRSFKKKPADLIVAGGGVTGAGILREAALAGLRVLLVDAGDFGAGSSGSSSKLVHGGLRYLQQMQPSVTYRSVREREALMKELSGLIYPLDFVLPVYSLKDELLFKFGLTVYDLFAGRSYHHRIDKDEMVRSFPGLRTESLRGGYDYYDAQTDDARLVLRILHDAWQAGGAALNYARVQQLHLEDGRVSAIRVEDRVTGKEWSLPCRLLVNATGFNVDYLRKDLGLPPIIRPLRGSHIVFHRDRLPFEKALAFAHPRDRRNVFILPWKGPGVTFVGTTDVDHRCAADDPVFISKEERGYLLEGAQSILPGACLQDEDILSTWSGVRPVIGHGKRDGGIDTSRPPSTEARDMFIHLDRGLLTVTGGKLTTFRNEAIHALRLLGDEYPFLRHLKPAPFVNPPAPVLPAFSKEEKSFLAGAYGPALPDLLACRKDGPEFVKGTRVSLMALRFALQKESTVHLDDLMIRRSRLGLILPDGGKGVLSKIGKLCSDAGWTARRFRGEVIRYMDMVESAGS